LKQGASLAAIVGSLATITGCLPLGFAAVFWNGPGFRVLPGLEKARADQP